MMAKISQSACPAFVPTSLVGPTCVVFESTGVQVAQVSLPVTAVAFSAIGSAVGTLISAQLPAGVTPDPDAVSTAVRAVLADLTSAVGTVAVDACIPAASEPTLAAHLLRDKIIDCGWVDAIVTLRTTAPFTTQVLVSATPAVPVTVTVPAGTIGSSMVTLSIHGEQGAPGVLPTDHVLERVLSAEGATTCLLGGTTVGTTGGLVTTMLVSVRAAYVVSTQVVRVLNPSLPSLAEATLSRPDVPPPTAARAKKRRTIIWSLSVDDKHAD